MSGRTVDIPIAKVFAPMLARSRYKAAYGGRGSGKSHMFADLLVDHCLHRTSLRVLCMREVQKSLDESVKHLVQAKIAQNNVGGGFSVRSKDIVTPGGGLIAFIGMQDHTADSIKSFEDFDIAYFEEAHTCSRRSLELLRPTIRKPGSELWFSWNPRHPTDPVDALLRSENPPEGAVIVKANHDSNPWFTDELEAERQHDLEHNRDRYGHIWEGHYEPMAIGAIFDRATIHQYRLEPKDVPDLTTIVVAVDPAGSAAPGANEHGIIVAGLGVDGRIYILADDSRHGTPAQWSSAAVAAFDEFEADRIIAERNYGGDMVAHTLRTVRPHGLPVKQVTARRGQGKHLRAEPVSALYKHGRVSHVGSFPELEDQLVLFTASGWEGPDEHSPDRADALVYACLDLLPPATRKVKGPRDHGFDEAWLSGRNETTGY